MSEHKYKEAYNKGFDDGKKSAFTGYCQQCYDELPLKDQVELMIKWGANKPNVCVNRKEEELKIMDKLNETIADVAFILDSLRVLRNIYETGDCNNCSNKECQYKPNPGQMVGHNCPFYMKGSQK